MRPSFVRFYNEMVIPNVDQIASTPRKVRSREQTRHRHPPILAPEEQPRPKSGDKRVVTVNLQNARTALMQYYAQDSEVVTNRQLIRKRYDDKVDWFRKHFVNIKFLQFYRHSINIPNFLVKDPGQENIDIAIPTFEEEIDIFCSVRATVNRNNLDQPHRIRTQQTFAFKDRENPIDPQVLKDGIDRLRSLGYSEAPVLRHDLFERMIDQVIFLIKQSIIMHCYNCYIISYRVTSGPLTESLLQRRPKSNICLSSLRQACSTQTLESTTWMTPTLALAE